MNEKITQPPPSHENPPRHAWRHLFKTTEGHNLLHRIAAAFIVLIVMGLVAFWPPQTSHMIGAG